MTYENLSNERVCRRSEDLKSRSLAETRVHWNVPSFWLQILLKGGMDILKKLVTHARSGPNSAILKSKMIRHSKIDFCKKWLVYGQYVYQTEAHGKQNIIAS